MKKARSLEAALHLGIGIQALSEAQWQSAERAPRRMRTLRSLSDRKLDRASVSWACRDRSSRDFGTRSASTRTYNRNRRPDSDCDDPVRPRDLDRPVHRPDTDVDRNSRKRACQLLNVARICKGDPGTSPSESTCNDRLGRLIWGAPYPSKKIADYATARFCTR